MEIGIGTFGGCFGNKARKVFPMMSQNEESSFYINDSLKNMRCYRYGEKCGNSLLYNSKLKTRKYDIYEQNNNLLLYCIVWILVKSFITMV